MYRVMIVDDEPPFIRIIKNIISRASNEFEVVGDAYNGIDALEKIPQIKPDVIFVDMKMPCMDGITLLKKVKEQYPEILPVIVSGYKDFEYAKEALKTGALEYILKPINPVIVSQVLEKIAVKLNERYLAKEDELLYNKIYNRSNESVNLMLYFNYHCYLAFVVRIGSLPNRHNNIAFMQSVQPFKNINFKKFGQLSKSNKCWRINGKDENEVILLFAFYRDENIDIKTIAKIIFKVFESSVNNITVVSSTKFYDIEKLSLSVETSKRALSRCLVIGKSQLVDSSNISSFSEGTPPILDKSMENKLLVLIKSKSLKNIRSEILKLFLEWERNSYPQLWVEKMLNQVMMLIEKHSPTISTKMSLNLEQQLEEVISTSSSFDELFRSAWDIAEDILTDLDFKWKDNDISKDLIEKVNSYILINMAEEISLQNVCNIFGVSQPYLSRLFRKYKNLSFNEYVTKLRISKAKSLIDEYPDMLLKDIAEVIGFNDQYYFSKIFKYISGVNPSEYKTTCSNKMKIIKEIASTKPVKDV